MKRGGRGQVWIETVMYTLIAFAIMGLVLGYARPKIEELQDRAIIEQSILMLKDIDSTMLSMGGAGNQRIIEISVRKGELKIDGEDDKMIFEIESRLEYSQPGERINNGNIEILTTKSGKFNIITLTRNFYDDYNLSNIKRDKPRIISKSPVAYTLKISNDGIYTTPPILCSCSSSEYCWICDEVPPWLDIFTAECVEPEKTTCTFTSKRQTIDFELL